MEAHPFPTDSIFSAALRISPPAHSLLCHNSLTPAFATRERTIHRKVDTFLR